MMRLNWRPTIYLFQFTIMLYNNQQTIIEMNFFSSTDSQPDYIDGSIPIFTSRHQNTQNDKTQYSQQISLSPLIEQPRYIIPQPSTQNEQILNLSINIYHKYITHSKIKLDSKIKKNINNTLNKNIKLFINKTNNTYIKGKKKQLLDKLRLVKGVQDPTKSLTNLFIQLGLLMEYSNNEDLFRIFDQIQTIKKNSMTKKLTREQQDIKYEELQFYKKVAIVFYQNPLKGVLLAYLRNHSQKKLQKQGKLDRFTKDGLQQTLTILTQQPFNYSFSTQNL